jgi:hypothetical protein
LPQPYDLLSYADGCCAPDLTGYDNHTGFYIGNNLNEAGQTYDPFLVLYGHRAFQILVDQQYTFNGRPIYDNDVIGLATLTPVPEPASGALFMAALVCVGFAAQRRASQIAPDAEAVVERA